MKTLLGTLTTQTAVFGLGFPDSSTLKGALQQEGFTNLGRMPHWVLEIGRALHGKQRTHSEQVVLLCTPPENASGNSSLRHS